MDLMDHILVGKARKLAEQAHAGQTDKAGRPYIEHVARVAATVEHPVSPGLAQAVAWLHDVMEDCGLGELDLMAAGMPREVIEAVEAVTHRPHEPRTDYYQRVAANDVAVAVKLADIADNCDPSRLAVLDEPTRTRLVEKYRKAREHLSRPV